MKKSKFLKKSLAMLLALMLVVAMIPLSASAAAPVMRQVAAVVGDYTTTLTAGGGGNTYTGVVPNTATEITLRVLVRDGNEVYITDESTATPTEVKGNDDDGDTVWEITTPGSLSNYENEDGNYEIQFAVVDETAPSDRLDFTAILTPTVVSTDIDIETLTFERVIGNTVIPQWGETTITQEDIYVTIPYDAADHAGYVRIRNMTLSSGASAEINGQSYTGVTNSAPEVRVDDDDDDEEQIVISNNGNSQTYTLHISVAPGFTSFTTEEGLDAVMFTETGDIAVLLPWGYTEGKDTVSVTPVFALDYDSAWASTTVNGSEFVSGENTLTVNSNDVYVATGNDGNFKAFGDAEGQWDWADKKDSDDFGTFMHQVAVPDEDRASTLHVNYSENVFRTYNVYFFETRQNNEAEISELTIGSETAVIDQEAGTIDITVPVGTNVAALNSNGDDEGALDVDIVASNNATITIPMQGLEFTDGENPATRVPQVAFNIDEEINATDPVIVRITSEDGLTTKEYELNVTVSDEYVNPEITDMALVSPDGETRVDAKPITDSQGRRVYYFQVPYEVYDKGELADWQLFWTKTVGATATYGATNIAMPKTGARLTGDEAFLPEVGSKDVGGMITVNILGEELSERIRGYYIQIDRTTGKTDTTLANVAIYGTPDFAAANEELDDLHDTADVDSRFSYKGTLDDSTYTVTVPYSVYEEWDGNNKEFGAIIEAAEKSNARVFLLQGNGNLEPIVNYEVPNPNYMTKVVTDEYLGTNATSADWTLYDGSTIVVLSETAYVDLLQDGVVRGLGESNDNNPGVYEGCINDWDDVQTTINGWAAYTLDIEQATANTSANLRNVRLIDGTGWTAELDVEFESGAGNAGRLVADIPYTLTSDFTVDNNGNVIIENNSFNPVYFEYDVDANAFVLGVNEAGAGSWDSAQPKKQSDTIDVPTAGTDNDGVFIDIADYLEMYTDNYELALEHYYTDGNPFLLIDRDGTVYICNYDDNNPADLRDDQLTANTALDTNRIAAVSESGKDFEKYTFALDVKAANSGTEISSFYFAEYPNAQGVIGSDDIITVTLPYGTEYTYLTPVYEVSDGAIVTVDDPELNGKPLFPGYTDVNFSTSRKMTVIAENETDSTEYTVRVVVSDRFSDVNPGDWFYDNVMGAANNGYISGMGDGTFNPKGATTRAQFASMIAKAMGYDDSLAGETRFKDVPADQWYAGAITYCFDNDIISGYDDGTFQPEKTITRQEAASILKNAFNLTGNSGEKFPDDSAIAGWAKENVYAVKHSGLMKGDADTGNFRPTSTIIRAEAASILMNANRAGLIK